MALFDKSIKLVLDNEGGYKLHKIDGDLGGLTFAGISYNIHPKWSGWELIEGCDVYDKVIQKAVHDFYRDEFWIKIKGGRIKNQKIANAIFDCAVNMGSSVSIKFAQIVCKVHIDGIMGPITLKALNMIDCKMFLYCFAIARISAYSDIVSSNSRQSKFLNGWIKRALRMT